jgi:hypothetical protein
MLRRATKHMRQYTRPRKQYKKQAAEPTLTVPLPPPAAAAARGCGVDDSVGLPAPMKYPATPAARSIIWSLSLPRGLWGCRSTIAGNPEITSLRLPSASAATCCVTKQQTLLRAFPQIVRVPAPLAVKESRNLLTDTRHAYCPRHHFSGRCSPQPCLTRQQGWP